MAQFEARCYQCDEELNARLIPDRGHVILEVEPCKKCKKDAKDKDTLINQLMAEVPASIQTRYVEDFANIFDGMPIVKETTR